MQGHGCGSYAKPTRREEERVRFTGLSHRAQPQSGILRLRAGEVLARGAFYSAGEFAELSYRMTKAPDFSDAIQKLCIYMHFYSTFIFCPSRRFFFPAFFQGP